MLRFLIDNDRRGKDYRNEVVSLGQELCVSCEGDVTWSFNRGPLPYNTYLMTMQAGYHYSTLNIAFFEEKNIGLYSCSGYNDFHVDVAGKNINND